MVEQSLAGYPCEACGIPLPHSMLTCIGTLYDTVKLLLKENQQLQARLTELERD